MNNRFNPDSDTSDSDAQEVRQPIPPTSDSAQQTREHGSAEAPRSGDDVQTSPIIINR